MKQHYLDRLVRAKEIYERENGSQWPNHLAYIFAFEWSEQVFYDEREHPFERIERLKAIHAAVREFKKENEDDQN